MRGLTIIIGDRMLRCGSISRAWEFKHGDELVLFANAYWRYRFIGPFTWLTKVMNA